MKWLGWLRTPADEMAQIATDEMAGMAADDATLYVPLDGEIRKFPSSKSNGIYGAI